MSLDRGHKAELETFFAAVRNGGSPPVDFTEYVYTTLATFAIEESLRRGVPVGVDPSVLQVVEERANQEVETEEGN